MHRYYDTRRRSLVFVHQQATATFWDQHWDRYAASAERPSSTKGTFASKITHRHLAPAEGWIIEGGCGPGTHVAALTSAGYRCVGVDFAVDTVLRQKRLAPDLDLCVGDVRCLPFPDGVFTGYWSVGVIEHFWDGFNEIASEMYRVLQPGGYLFLSFPYMSILRRLKAALGAYPEWDDRDIERFYQFALPAKPVQESFESRGFSLVESTPLGGLKGTKGELAPLRHLLELLFYYRGDNVAVRATALIVDRLLALVSGHVMLFVFQKR